MKKSQYVHNPLCLAYRVIALYSVIDMPFLQFVKKFVAAPALSCSNVLITLHYHFPHLFLVFFYFPSIIQNLLWAHTTHLLLSNVSLVYSKTIPNTRNKVIKFFISILLALHWHKTIPTWHSIAIYRVNPIC